MLRSPKQCGRERVAKTQPVIQQKSNGSVVALSLLLVALTVFVYARVRTHAFLTYDDYGYVVNNSHITKGLSWQTVGWSLTAGAEANWHPVTWISHALDCQFFGLNAGAHHLINVALHALNALVLFLLLKWVTGAVERSFVVAALFAWHPFNVQSVAWIAERKNLLSTLFFLLAVGAYVRYTQKLEAKRFALLIAVFLLALASKPMVVTFPFVLLLLDYWPLQRVQGWNSQPSRLGIPPQPVRRLLLEKLPLFALSFASCVVTVWAQESVGALQKVQDLPIATRIENGLFSYIVYGCKTFLPSGFAVFYPHRGPFLPIWKPVLASILLCAVSAFAWSQRNARPYLSTGWLWFLGTLVPVIGLVQVGDQAMADRYAYLPLVGIFIAVVWLGADLLGRYGAPMLARWTLASIVLGMLCGLTFRELRYWENDATLWSRALNVTGGDVQVERKFGNAMVLLGDPESALPHLIKAADANPEDIIIRKDLGVCLLAEGRTQDAIHEFESTIKLTNDLHPDSTDHDFWQFRSSAFIDLGIAFTLSKDYDRALTNFRNANIADAATVTDVTDRLQRAISSSPAESDFITLSLILSAKGKTTEAASVLQTAVAANPDYELTRGLMSYLDVSSR
jgi:protein O-mannosyl-transferase